MPDRFLNIATYRFTPLADLPALRQRLFDTAEIPHVIEQGERATEAQLPHIRQALEAAGV